MQLICGDCLEVMKTLPDKSVDLTVTSPPYDNLRTYNGHSQFDFEGIAKELYRLTKPGGVVVWVVGDATIKGSETGTSFRQALYFKEIGFNLHDTMIYEKAGISFPDINRYYQAFEYMFIFSRGKIGTYNLLADRPNIWAGQKVHSTVRNPNGTLTPKACLGNETREYGIRYNIWRIPHNLPGRACHPASFPVKLAKDHILSWSNPGDLVMDCFMGSGTTGKAAVLTGRDFIGIEIDKGYFEIAEKQVVEAQSQGTLEGTH